MHNRGNGKGGGIAAASLNQGANSRLMTGTGNIKLLLGGNVAPHQPDYQQQSGQADAGCYRHKGSALFHANGCESAEQRHHQDCG